MCWVGGNLEGTLQLLILMTKAVTIQAGRWQLKYQSDPPTSIEISYRCESVHDIDIDEIPKLCSLRLKGLAQRMSLTQIAPLLLLSMTLATIRTAAVSVCVFPENLSCRLKTSFSVYPMHFRISDRSNRLRQLPPPPWSKCSSANDAPLLRGRLLLLTRQPFVITAISSLLSGI
jgi:hypothetical protein